VYHILSYDDPNEDLISRFPKVCRIIEDAKDSERRVLVHCYAGISRSATFIVAFLMKHRKCNLNDAVLYLRKSRIQIDPNFGFLIQLELWAFDLGQND